MNIFLKLLISSLMLLVSFTAAFANGGTGKATKYEVTMLKLEL